MLCLRRAGVGPQECGPQDGSGSRVEGLGPACAQNESSLQGDSSSGCGP